LPIRPSRSSGALHYCSLWPASLFQEGVLSLARPTSFGGISPVQCWSVPRRRSHQCRDQQRDVTCDRSSALCLDASGAAIRRPRTPSGQWNRSPRSLDQLLFLLPWRRQVAAPTQCRIMVAPILYTVASLWNPVAALLIELVGHAALGSRQAPLYLTPALARHLRPNYAPTSHPSRVTYATGRGVTVTGML
jgi:hypothetical protein